MKRSPAIRIAGALAGAVLLLGAFAARGQDLDKALLLAAAPELKGPYARTALIVLPMGDKHVGFILNRATNMKLATVFPEHPPSAKVIEPLFFGGPEAAGAIFALLRRDPGEPSLHLFGDVFMTAHAAAIDRIIEQTPNDARYFAGFVGWGRGELAQELERGWWLTAIPDASEVFRKDTGGMWGELVKRLTRRGKGQLETQLKFPLL